MIIECLTCGKKSDKTKGFYEVSGRVGWRYICKECAKEVGINNFMQAGFHGNISLLKKYVIIHPEAQSRLEILEDELRQENKELIEGMKNIAKNIKSKIEQKIDCSNFTTDKLIDVVKNKIASIDKLSDEELIKRMESFIVENPGIILLAGEKCFYQGSCYSVRLKNVVTGTSGNSIHIGGKGAFGIYMGTGISQRNIDRNTVAEKYPGNFYITNKRMICTAPKLAFEIKLTNITSLTTYSDGLNITVKDKSYIVETKDIESIKEIIAVNNEGMKRGLCTNLKDEKCDSIKINEDKLKNDEDKSIHLIREYKKLLDEGIITNEEFEAKKKKLLEI